METFVKDLSEKLLKIELATSKGDEIISVSKNFQNFIMKMIQAIEIRLGIGK